MPYAVRHSRGDGPDARVRGQVLEQDLDSVAARERDPPVRVLVRRALEADQRAQAAEHLAKIREADGWRPGPERIGLADGNHAQTGDRIQARLNDDLITADGQWLANRDIFQVGRIYRFGSNRQVGVRRGNGSNRAVPKPRCPEYVALLESEARAALWRRGEAGETAGCPGGRPVSAGSRP